MSGTKVRGGLVLVSALMAMRGPVWAHSRDLARSRGLCDVRIDFRDSALTMSQKCVAAGMQLSPDLCAGAHAHKFAGARACGTA